MEISRDDALKWIEQLDEKTIKAIYKNYSRKIKKEKKDAITIPEIDIDKNSSKYKVLLKYVNAILNNIEGKSQISDLTNFKDIDREDIIKEVNKKVLIDMEKDLFKYYNKTNSGFYRKSPNMPLNCLRCMCKELGLLLTFYKKDVYEKVNDKHYRRTKYFYRIKTI